MKDRSKAKQRLALRSRDIHVGWIVGAGVSMLIFLLATFATAYRHDVYSSSLGLRDLVSTDVWFRVFLALTCFSLLLFLGLLVYAFIAGRIGGSGDSEGQELMQVVTTPPVEESVSDSEEKAPAIEQPKRIIIDTARLRDIFNSEFMHEWAREGKTYLDQVIEDLQFVRDHYLMGAKKGENTFTAKNIFEIASLLHNKNRHFRKVYNSYADWCRILFKCLAIEGPNEGSIKKYQDYSSQVKQRFYYLL